MRKRIIHNVKHLPSTLLGLFLIAFISWLLYKGTLPADGFVLILMAVLPIIGIGGDKPKDENTEV